MICCCDEGLVEERLMESWEKVEGSCAYMEPRINPEARKVRAAHGRSQEVVEGEGDLGRNLRRDEGERTPSQQ